MEKQQLPNGVAAILLGIFGFVCCCLFGAGLIPSTIGFFLARKSEKIYQDNPDEYGNYSQIKTAKIIALIAMIINILFIIRFIYIVSTVGWDEMWEQARQMQEQMGLPTN